MIEYIIGICKKYSYTVILLYYLIIGKWFSYLEATIRPKYYMFSRLDPYIPFIKEFVIPYLLWFSFIVITLVYLGLTSKYDFLKLCIFMFSGMTICLIIYGLFPNGQNLRPEIAGNDIFSNLVRLVYSNDTPTNSAPSIHAVNSIAVYLALVNCDKLKDKKAVKLTAFISMLLIIMSTVFIKQHSILDVVYGIILSTVLYLAIYKASYTRLYGFIKAKAASANVNTRNYKGVQRSINIKE